jgi:hypothetical protein
MAVQGKCIAGFYRYKVDGITGSMNGPGPKSTKNFPRFDITKTPETGFFHLKKF